MFRCGWPIADRLTETLGGLGDVAMGAQALIGAEAQAGAGDLGGLTAKQREVLDLLIQHKTSKEISRLLGISPHTVDQRIMLARSKLHVATRNEVAQAYRHLLTQEAAGYASETYQQLIYGSSQLGERATIADSSLREAHGPAGAAREDQGLDAPDQPHHAVMTRRRHDLLSGGPVATEYYRVLPEAFDGPGGTLLRLGAIVVIAALLTLVILGGLAIQSELSHMLNG